jgi:Fur family ferric uptake transcriptional regulator
MTRKIDIEALCADKGLRITEQRRVIAQILSEAEDHPDVETLHERAASVDPKISIATVYRTVRLLRECGLAAERHFHDGEARFENVAAEQHHDHLICERCGRIVEFSNTEIEELQERVAHKLDFVISGHKMELYGICGDCRTGRSPRRPARGEPHVFRT